MAFLGGCPATWGGVNTAYGHDVMVTLMLTGYNTVLDAIDDLWKNAQRRRGKHTQGRP